MLYYIDRNNRAFGPFPVERIREMLKSGAINSATRISTDKRNWGTPSDFPEIENRVEPSQVPPSPMVVEQPERSEQAPQIEPDAPERRATSTREKERSIRVVTKPRKRENSKQSSHNQRQRRRDDNDLVRRIKLNFLLTWIFFGVAILFGLLSFLFGPRYDYNFTAFSVLMLLVILYVVASFVSAIFFFSFIHAYWKSIPREFARATPDEAVAFLFIPVWNIYWFIVILCDGARNMNKAMEHYDLYSRRDAGVSHGLAIATSICILTGLIPIGLVMIFILMLQMKNAATDLIYALENA